MFRTSFEWYADISQDLAPQDRGSSRLELVAHGMREGRSTHRYRQEDLRNEFTEYCDTKILTLPKDLESKIVRAAKYIICKYPNHC